MSFMNLWNKLIDNWQTLSISRKFALGSAFLVMLILLVASSAYMALQIVRQRTEAIVDTSTEIQRLTLEMHAGLEQARRLERDFFLRYPTIGFWQAERQYAQPSRRTLQGLIELGETLQQRMQHAQDMYGWNIDNVDFATYMAAAVTYAVRFDDTVALVEELAAPGGVRARLERSERQLQALLTIDSYPEEFRLLQEMRLYSKDYLLTRQRPYMQLARNTAGRLRTILQSSLELESSPQDDALLVQQGVRSQAQTLLDNFLGYADRLLALDDAIDEAMRVFELQAVALMPVADSLRSIANNQIALAREDILYINRIATVLLVIAVLVAVIAAMSISSIINNNLTHNIIRLTRVARRLQAGKLEARSSIRRRDEIGILAQALNDMAERLSGFINELEDRVRARTAELSSANEKILQLNQRLEEENVRMESELELTRELQTMILPPVRELREVKELDIAGYMEPASEVGGDYYDVLQHCRSDGSRRVKIGIGDVTGHGLGSGLLMLMTQTAIRTLLQSDLEDPVRFFDILNRTLYDNLQRMGVDKSLTLSLLDYHPHQPQRGVEPNPHGAATLRFSGQHEHVLFVQAGGHIDVLNTIDLGFPLGLIDDIAPFITEKAISLHPGDGVVLYTDGITEAENQHGEQYGLERFCYVISRNWHRNADSIKTAIVQDLQRHIGQQRVYDDITLLILKQRHHLSTADSLADEAKQHSPTLASTAALP